MEKYFCKLANYPILSKKYIDEACNSNFKISLAPNLWLAPTTFKNSTFVKNIENHFKTQCVLKYHLNIPNSYYDWHIDARRDCALNWLIKTNDNSSVFYREVIEKAVPTNHRPLFYRLIEAEYELYKPTLLNTKFEHCVVNNSDEERIILSLSIVDVNYDQALDYFINLQISDY